MSDIIQRGMQSAEGARLFGRADKGLIQQPELVEVSLMRMVAAPVVLEDSARRKPVERMGGWGVAKKGGRYVCPLPPEYDHNVGIIPHDGMILVTHPTLPKLVCDTETGKCRRAV